MKDYAYVIFDATHKTYSHASFTYLGISYIDPICLEKHGVNLSQNDFDRSAAEHWDRVRPGGMCNDTRDHTRKYVYIGLL